MTEPGRPLEALIAKWRVEASQTLSAASMWPQDSHQFDALMALCEIAKRHAEELAALIAAGSSVATTEPEPPHHCSDANYVAMIAWLQNVESGEIAPERSIADVDWRTKCGVLWRMLHWATRCTDASVDAFLKQYEARPAVEPPERVSEGKE